MRAGVSYCHSPDCKMADYRPIPEAGDCMSGVNICCRIIRSSLSKRRTVDVARACSMPIYSMAHHECNK